MAAINYLFILLIIPILNVGSEMIETAQFEMSNSELLLVNVVFRHGDRTPTKSIDEMFRPEKYPFPVKPYDTGALTNDGKRRSYQLGLVLRQMYNSFLGSMYRQEAIKARSTSIVRSKMTLLVLLAALYPPVSVQRWSSFLNWQPINTFSLPVEQDGLLIPIGCNLYQDAARRAEPETRGLNEYSDLAEDLTRRTGRNVTTLMDMFELYHNFIALEHMGVPLPGWVREVYPNGRLRDAAVAQFKLFGYTTELNRLNGGMLLRRFIEDMYTKVNSTGDSRKINLYSSHDVTVASMLQALGVYTDQIPAYCSGVIVELRKKAGNYYVRALYYSGIPAKITEIQIPGCGNLCPLDKFFELRKQVIPTQQELKCDTKEPAQL